MLKEMTFHPQIERGLNIASQRFPDSVEGARAALRILQKPLLENGSTAETWTSSTLVRVGFPFEFAFTTRGDHTLRYTTEFYEPASNPRDRLLLVNPLLEQLRVPVLPQEWVERFSLFQKTGALKYGVWIGGRHTPASETFKLYVDIPAEGSPEAESWGSSFLEGNLHIGKPVNQLDMVGWDPDGDRIELYYRIEDMHPLDLKSLMGRVGLEAEHAALFELLQEMHGWRIKHKMPGPTFGYSYSISQSGGPTVFTFYTFANTLMGGDMSIRKRVMEKASERSWDLSYYPELSAPLAQLNSFVTHHGMAGFVTAKGIDPFFSFGISPPPAQL